MGKLNDVEKMLLHSLPEGSEEKVRLVTKIRKYRNECGCSMGARFLVAATLATILYWVVLNEGGQVNILWRGLASLLFIFLSAVIGKLTGLSIARFRLCILLKSAHKKLLNH